MLGPVTMLVNCAGYATCRRFENLEIGDFRVSVVEKIKILDQQKKKSKTGVSACDSFSSVTV